MANLPANLGKLRSAINKLVKRGADWFDIHCAHSTSAFRAPFPFSEHVFVTIDGEIRVPIAVLFLITFRAAGFTMPLHDNEIIAIHILNPDSV
jgi:hypothetical protein